MVRIYVYTVFTRILAAATINFSRAQVRLLIEGGSYSRAALIKNNVHAQLTYVRVRTRKCQIRTLCSREYKK